MTKREEQLLFMREDLSAAIWKGLALLDEGRPEKARETLTEAVEENDLRFESLDFGPLDMEEIIRENSRRR